jgi:protein-S-isoprenylcysteine O-methyltransferase Ste14
LKKRAVRDIVFVSIQLTLFVLFVIPAPSYTFHLPLFWQYIALIIAAVGLGVIALAIVQLNKNLTPFPTPVESGTLIQTGLYRVVRHPIYSGIILTALGCGLYLGSTWKISIGVALWVLFYFKSRYEETLLIQQYSDYEAYRKRTSRFFPFL